MNLLIPGAVVSPLSNLDLEAPTPLVEEPHLILYANEKSDQVMMIPIAARYKSSRYYFRGPNLFSYAALVLQTDLNCPVLTCNSFKPRAASIQTDEELAARYRRRGQSEPPQVSKLKLRWSMIEPLVTSQDKTLLFDPDQRKSIIEKRAKEIIADLSLFAALTSAERAAKTKRGHAYQTTSPDNLRRVQAEILRLLNQFWAGGSMRGALIGFEHACGGRGKRKVLGAKKVGRKNAAVRQGHDERSGVNVSADSRDAKIIKHCYDTWVVRHTTVGTAFRRMCREFYSEEVQQPNGSVKKVEIAAHLRPTEAQFRYWGTTENPGMSAWRAQLPPKKFEKSFRPLLGSVTDDVYAVGQRGGIDSSPPDIQLVRAVDRLARVGGAHRVLIAESTVGYIPGFYLGFDPPSARTVRLAMFNAMDTEKQLWLEDLGLEDEIDADDFIPMWFEAMWADNTDLRNEEVKKCLTEIGTDVHFISTYRADMNSRAETSHLQLHRSVDHKLSGSTYGKPTERGESSANERARLNLMEAIRENVRALHTHNTMEFEDVRPIRMRDKNIPCTRLAITRELIRTGHVARAVQAVDLARRFLLPRYNGTFTASGVRLHRSNEGTKSEFINHIAYVSSHPSICRLMEEARRGGKSDAGYFRKSFIVNPYRPRRIWWVDPETSEEIELTLKVLKLRDPDLPFRFTIPDMVDRDAVEGDEGLVRKESVDRQVGAMEARQRDTCDAAERVYQKNMDERGKPLTKAAMKANKRENREAETAGTIFGMPIPEKVLAQADAGNESGEGANAKSEPMSKEEVVGDGSMGAAEHDQPPPKGEDRPRRSLLQKLTSPGA